MPRRFTAEQVAAIRRGEYGWKLRPVSERLGVSPSAVSRIMRGISYPEPPSEDEDDEDD